MEEEAAAKADSLLGYALENLALVNREVVTQLKPLTGFWWLNVFLPIALIAVVALGLHSLLGGRGWRDHRKGLWPLVAGQPHGSIVCGSACNFESGPRRGYCRVHGERRDGIA